jgi:hypothetical protein
MKVIAAVAAIVVVGALAVGVVAWNGSGSAAQCDHDQLAAAMHDSIEMAERGSHAQASVNMPDACGDDDMMEAVPGVSRSWHVMPGGTLMRAEHHSDDR